jgi:hypothetical protein
MYGRLRQQKSSLKDRRQGCVQNVEPRVQFGVAAAVDTADTMLGCECPSTELI